MIPAYYDTAYLFKALCAEAGSAEVIAHARTVRHLVCSLHGRAEFASICHRKIREGSGAVADLITLLAQLESDTRVGAIVWLPVTEAVISRVEAAYRSTSTNVFLRAADALHLASAAENGCDEIYSNDRQLLAAAPVFGLRGVNVITSSV
jgi:predicted nucleic acid-binding protein